MASPPRRTRSRQPAGRQLADVRADGSEPARACRLIDEAPPRHVRRPSGPSRPGDEYRWHTYKGRIASTKPCPTAVEFVDVLQIVRSQRTSFAA